MYRIQIQEDLEKIPLPCNYFDLIGGTSTGGFVPTHRRVCSCLMLDFSHIALMLGRLCMSVDEAIGCCGILSQNIFSVKQPFGSDGKFKTSKLEGAIKEIVETHTQTRDADERMYKDLMVQDVKRECIIV